MTEQITQKQTLDILATTLMGHFGRYRNAPSEYEQRDYHIRMDECLILYARIGNVDYVQACEINKIPYAIMKK